MKKTYNVQLRVDAYNKLIVGRENKIRDTKKGYTSTLFKRTIDNGRLFANEEGVYRIYKGIHRDKSDILIEAQNMPALLYYLYKHFQDPGAAFEEKKLTEYQKLNRLVQNAKESDIKFIKVLKRPKKSSEEREALLATLNAMQQPKHKVEEKPKVQEPEKKGFEVVEENGVLKIKGTNFIISQIL